MKILTRFLFTTLFLGYCMLLQAQDSYLSFANSEITIQGTDTLFEVDITIASSNAANGFKLSSGQLYFDYSGVFGQAIDLAGGVQVSYPSPKYLLGLKDAYIGQISVYGDVTVNDNTNSRFSVSWQQDVAASCIDRPVQENPQPLFRLKMKYTEGMVDNDDLICFAQGNIFTDQLFTACGPYGSCNTFATANCSGEPGMQVFSDFYSCDTENACALLDISPASTSTATTCTKTNDPWTHVVDDGGEVVLSYLAAGNNLDGMSTSVFVENEAVIYEGLAYSNRHYLVNAATNLAAPITVRLYLKQAELDQLLAAASSTGTTADDFVFLSDLGLMQYQGPSEDGILDLSDASMVNLLVPNGYGQAFDAHYLEFQLPSLAEFWLTSSLRWLPVELTAFTGTLRDRDVVLDWGTESETNSSSFEIERSNDGERFFKIGKIAAAGESISKINYQFIDENPAPGPNYYRLKMLDQDGSYTYSQIVTVRLDHFGIIDLLPNPVKNEGMEVYLANSTSPELHVMVYDNLGRLVYESTQNVTGEVSSFVLPTSQFAEGSYFLRLIDGEYFTVQKFIKLN